MPKSDEEASHTYQHALHQDCSRKIAIRPAGRLEMHSGVMELGEIGG